MVHSLIVEGDMTLWTQEGGFADDSIEIGSEELSEKIKEHFKPVPQKYYAYHKVGPVRVTIERLDNGTSPS